jgi:hypothetical protein
MAPTHRGTQHGGDRYCQSELIRVRIMMPSEKMYAAQREEQEQEQQDPDPEAGHACDPLNRHFEDIVSA